MTDLNFFELSMLGLTVLLFLSTAICGLWLFFSPEEAVKQGDRIFHMGIAFLSMVVGGVTLFLLTK